MGRRGMAGGGRTGSRGKAARIVPRFVASFSPGSSRPGTETRGRALAGSPWRSFPSLEWERHRDMPPGRVFRWPSSARSATSAGGVLGFLPYWTLGRRWSPSIASHAGLFRGARQRGRQPGSARDWASATLMPLVTEAGGRGPGVLAVTCFDGNQMAALLSSAANRRRAVEGIVNLVTRGRGRGQRRFRGLPGPRSRLRDVRPGMRPRWIRPWAASQVTVDTPAVDWSGAYDYDQLALAGDGW
jgi:hypothetical protein